MPVYGVSAEDAGSCKKDEERKQVN